jgi:hypothetical protein
MRVWLDDVRVAPSGWTWVKTSADAIALLAAGGVEEISLDHDLGDDVVNGTGYSVVCWIEEAVATRAFAPPRMQSTARTSSAASGWRAASRSSCGLRVKGRARRPRVRRAGRRDRHGAAGPVPQLASVLGLRR